jgi:hypothetical protein
MRRRIELKRLRVRISLVHAPSNDKLPSDRSIGTAIPRLLFDAELTDVYGKCCYEQSDICLFYLSYVCAKAAGSTAEPEELQTYT